MTATSSPRQWELFNDIAPADVQAVLAVARRRRFARGETIFHEGDPGETMHLVAKGHVAVRITTPLGDVATLRVLGPGSFFGELAVVSPAPRNATIAAVDAVETLTLHREQLYELRDLHPTVDRVIQGALVAEVRRLSVQLSEALYVPVPKRLVRRLVELAELFTAADGPTVIPLTQDDVAGLVGTTRPTANKILQKLADAGLVTLSRGKIAVVDADALARKGR